MVSRRALAITSLVFLGLLVATAVRPRRGERGRGVAFALRGGLVGVLAFDGKPRWSAKTDQVRRLRSIDLDGDRGHES